MSQNGQTHFKNLAANAVSDHFGRLCIIGLKAKVKSSLFPIVNKFIHHQSHFF